MSNPIQALSNNGDPEIQLSCVSNMYVRMMHFKHEGDIEAGHTHPFDHLTLLADGAVKITVDGITKEFHAPKMIFIQKEKVHELVALRDKTTAYCIHPIRDGSRVEDIIDPSMMIIPEGAAGIRYLENTRPDLYDYIVGR